MKPNLPLLALAVGAFGIGTTEFAPMGLLSAIARDLHVSIPTAGLLITGYAVGVMVGAPTVTLTTRRLPRKTLLVGLMAVFTAGNLMAALASGYDMLMVARIVTSMCHGAFFGVGSIVASRLVPPGRGASAIATMFAGLTIANIGGVPLAAWVGQTIGWRIAFFGIGGFGVLAMLSLVLALPAAGAPEPVADIGREVRVLRQPAVLGALGTTVLGSGAMFTLLTYIVPVLQHRTGAQPLFVTAMLVLVGVGFTVGNALGGRLADRALTPTLLGFLGLLVVLMLAFCFTMDARIPAATTIFLWAAATFAIVPPLQMRVMAIASAAPSLASSVNIGAFNLGNALGAALGGGVLAAGLGYNWIPAAGATVALCGLLLVALQARARPAQDLASERA